jgi:protein arginine N-methyltransferase 1
MLKYVTVWNNVYGFDFTPMRNVALAEPLVDTVELKAVVTRPCLAFSIDLYTITAAELAFSVPFVLECTRTDYIHAFISWFDIEFTACHKPIKFSTGPHAKYTHWKQTVFYIKNHLSVKDGEQIKGQISSKPTEKNRRDLDVVIQYKFDVDDSLRASEERCDYKM